MKRSIHIVLNNQLLVIERSHLPTALINAFQLIPSSRPNDEFLSRIAPVLSKPKDSLKIRWKEWIFKLSYDHSKDYIQIEFIFTGESTSMKDIEKYKLLVEEADDIIYETNMNGEFTYVNPKAVAVTGYTSSQLIGKKYLDLIREDWQADARAFYRKQFAESKRSTYMELPLIAKDGREIWVGQKVRLLENDNEVVGTMAIARDVTDRYEVQTALQASEEKYRSIIQNLQFGLMEVDLKGEIVFVNDSMVALSGYSREELIGENAEELFLDVHQKRIINNEHGKRNKGIPSAYELSLKTKSGEKRWALISGAPKFDIDGDIVGSIGIHVDITERKRDEQELFATKEKLDRYKLGAERINEISSNRELSYADQIKEGLKIAADYLELPIAILSEINGNHYTLLDFYLAEEIAGLNRGDVFELSDTYCDLTLNNYGRIAIADFSNSKYADHPCFDAFGLETYIGASYFVSGELRGTINFSKASPRSQDFDLYDLEFVELLAKWIGFLITQKETLEALRLEQGKLQNQNAELQEKEEYLTAINDFVTKLLDNESLEGIAWEIAENVIHRFGFEDCVIYLVDDDRKKLSQLAAFGPKKVKDREIYQPIKIEMGQGIVGSVAKHGKAEIVADTTLDERYLEDDAKRRSELSVPIIADGQVIGVIDSEHPEKDYFNKAHLATLETIANLAANRMKNAFAKKEQLRAEQELKDSELKLRRILHSAIDGVISIDQKGVITEWNKQAEFIFGFKASEVFGKTLQETIIPSNFREQHKAGMKHYINTGEGPVLNQKIEISALRKNGEEFPIELAIIPIMTKGEHSFTAFVSDITIQKRVQHEMEKALQKEKELNELKSRFVSMTSHEFRTPLTTIKQNIDLINYRLEKKFPEQVPEFSKYIGRVESEISRVTDLMNDILMLGRIDGGKLSIKLKEIDFVNYVKEHLKKLTESRQDQRQISLKILGVPRKVNIDASLFDHVISNLVSNAFKYSAGKADPEMTITFNKLKTYQLHIKDYGIGIPKKDHRGLFQSFSRATNVKNIQGSGLGLSIVKEFTLMHGGDIDFTTKEGEGSEFIIELPYNL